MLLKLRQKTGMKQKSQKFPERRGISPLLKKTNKQTKQSEKEYEKKKEKEYDIQSHIAGLPAG